VVNWSESKDRFLKAVRGISFQDIAEEILSGRYIDILENPGRPGQDVFIVRINDYTWVVPFVLREDDTIFLKTAYPSRKFHKRYGGADEKKE
jgi:disulfide oxidoreductase YuzD